MDYRIIETAIIILIFLGMRIVIGGIFTRVKNKYDYSVHRVEPIQKFVSLFVFVTFIIAAAAVWGIEQNRLITFITSVLAFLGVAFFAQWSLLSNITASIILLFNHPVRLYDTVAIMESKDYVIQGTVIKVGLFFVTLETEEQEQISLPNNIFIIKNIRVIKGKEE